MATASHNPSLERVGLLASVLCVVHCAATPIALAMIPSVSAQFSALEWIERPLLALAIGVSLWLLYRGAWQRRQWRPLGLFAAALVCFAVGLAVGGHAIPMVAGGLLLGGAQWTNLRHRHRPNHPNHADCAC